MIYRTLSDDELIRWLRATPCDLCAEQEMLNRFEKNCDSNSRHQQELDEIDSSRDSLARKLETAEERIAELEEELEKLENDRC